MSSLALTSTVPFALGALIGARVTLPFSEVLQLNDMQSFNDKNRLSYKAEFNCDDGCRAYTDQNTDVFSIAQNDIVIVNFTDVFGGASATIGGYQLPAGAKYDIRGASNDHAFVFYVVSKRAPNYGAAVFSAFGGVAVTGQPRFATFLSSANAIEFAELSGSFPSGYPRVYATGYDAVSDVYGVSRCKPVYQARSQSNAEQSRPTIFSPITTVDFGFDGAHSVSANLTDGASLAKSATSSVVYMSPGYVGCPFEGGSLYASNLRNAKVSDTFTLIAGSLDIYADFNDVAPSETVFLVVNQDDLDFFNTNSSSFTKHYEQGAFKVSISWKRTTPSSSWAVQLDFGAKSGSGLSMLIAAIVIIVFASNN